MKNHRIAFLSLFSLAMLAVVSARAQATPSSPTNTFATSEPRAAVLKSGWRPLLDQKLSSWELWMGVPHQTVVGLPPGTPTSPDGHEGIPLGLNNDPKHVFSVRIENGEPVLCITGEIFGGLTTLEIFSNYHFRTQFKWGERKWEPKLTVVRDNGILYHCTGPHGIFWHVWKRSLEFQVEEKGMGDLYCLGGTGADITAKKGPRDWVYDPTGVMQKFRDGPGAVGTKAAHLLGNFEKPLGEWNELELYTIGQTAVSVVNGQVVQVLRNTFTTTGPPYIETPLGAGQIQIQSEGAEAYYRCMEIQPITEFPAEIKKAARL
jgi:hypothetical protein